jgi:hypothetical protein
MTDDAAAVAPGKTLFGKAFKVLDYLIRGLTLAAIAPLMLVGGYVILMGAGSPSGGSWVLLVGFGMLVLIAGVVAISAIAPQLLTRRLPLPETARLLLSRVPVYFFFGAACAYGLIQLLPQMLSIR